MRWGRRLASKGSPPKVQFSFSSGLLCKRHDIVFNAAKRIAKARQSVLQFLVELFELCRHNAFFQIDLLCPFTQLVGGMQGLDELLLLIFGLLLALFEEFFRPSDFLVRVDIGQMA